MNGAFENNEWNEKEQGVTGNFWNPPPQTTGHLRIV